LKKDIIPEIIW